MPAIVRRTSTKVVNGQVTRKNRSDWSEVNGCVIRNDPVGRGYRQVISPKQLKQFIEIIPDWTLHSHRLATIALAGPDLTSFGYFAPYQHLNVSMIALCAWPKNLWTETWIGFLREHRHILEQLGVAYECRIDSAIVKFNVAQARAFTLLHVFMHELGHHRDWLRRRGFTSPAKRNSRKNLQIATGTFSTQFTASVLAIRGQRKLTRKR